MDGLVEERKRLKDYPEIEEVSYRLGPPRRDTYLPAQKMKRGFTLLEVLLTISLMGLFFWYTFLHSFYSSARNSYALLEFVELTRDVLLSFGTCRES
ncbi:MAG: type II secretion system protein [Aquificaceae bacterium]